MGLAKKATASLLAKAATRRFKIAKQAGRVASRAEDFTTYGTEVKVQYVGNIVPGLRGPNGEILSNGMPLPSGGIDAALMDGRFREVHDAAPVDRIYVIRAGIAAKVAVAIAGRMHLPDAHFNRMLGLPDSTVRRKVKTQQALSAPDSEKLLGIGLIVGQVQKMMGENAPAEFDAASWVAKWMAEPAPALGGKLPGEFMDTMQGQAMVANLLGSMANGVYW